MTALDIGILVITALALLRGLKNGFLTEVGGIAGLVAGWFLATRYYAPLAGILRPYPRVGDWATEIAFAVLFVAGVIIVHLVVRFLQPILRRPVLGSLNSFAGLLVGGFKGLLLCSIVLLFILWVAPATAHQVRESEIAGRLLPLVDWLATIVGPR